MQTIMNEKLVTSDIANSEFVSDIKNMILISMGDDQECLLDFIQGGANFLSLAGIIELVRKRLSPKDAMEILDNYYNSIVVSKVVGLKPLEVLYQFIDGSYIWI